MISNNKQKIIKKILGGYHFETGKQKLNTEVLTIL